MRSILFLTGVLAASILFFWGCGNDNECKSTIDISATKIDIEVERLESKIEGLQTRSQVSGFLRENPVVAEYFFMKSQYPNDSVLVDELWRKIKNPHFDSLLAETKHRFADFSNVEYSFKQAFANFKHYYPEFKIPKIKTVVTGFNHDLYISDSLIVISLDYYLGAGAKYRPKGMYEYVLERYEPEYIVPSCMLLYGISPAYNSVDMKDKTMLADAVAYGKSFFFAKQMIPCTPDSILIWYDKEEMEGVFQNQDVIWAHFVENELLYETDHFVKRKYIDDRPKTYEIGEKCPGRIGMWLGWQIVKKYSEEKPELTLSGLMETKNAKKLFAQSKYKPEKPGIFN